MHATLITPDDIQGLLPETADLHVSLFDQWTGLRGVRPFPGLSSIQPETLKPWLGRINLLDVQRDPLDFCYRLYGSKLTQDSQYDLTGKLLSDLTDEQREIVQESYQTVVNDRKPLLTMVIPKEPWRDIAAYSRLILPFGDEPDMCERLLVLILRLSPDEMERHRERMPLWYRFE
ncbi:PAS domain-containing protein [Aestuariispira insulae]|uniref:PAS domain-containing protein n=1 Tax=Aestuariispira insulae TaxID=1461337 RepID=A0A3D9HSA7_9PROT|nr:PAS domain-containing protein [Aestuariispira insulae]RED52374.1 PAS domain-containing protein [Aestuariispira insulae]